MIKYVNIETGELLTEAQLYNFFKNVVVKEEPHYRLSDYSYYINCCKTENNGNLKEVHKMDEWNIRAMLHDEYITQKTADALINLDLYATNSGEFYTTDGRYFYNVTDLNTIQEAAHETI